MAKIYSNQPQTAQTQTRRDLAILSFSLTRLLGDRRRILLYVDGFNLIKIKVLFYKPKDKTTMNSLIPFQLLSFRWLPVKVLGIIIFIIIGILMFN